MNNGKGKGKMIATESGGASPNPGVRVEGSSRPTSSSIPGSNLNHFHVNPNYPLGMHNNVREVILPPLAHREVFGKGKSSNGKLVWVDFSNTRDLSLRVPHPTFIPCTPLAPPSLMLCHSPRPSEADFVHSPSILNPYPQKGTRTPLDDQTLFFTFSCGETVTEQEIFWHFAVKYGLDSVLKVDVHKPKHGPSRFGRLIFSSAVFPSTILDGRPEARIMISNKSMIFKKYMPRDHRGF